MAKQKLVEELREEIDQIRIVDSHEHIRRQEDIRAEGSNLFTSLKYSLLCWPLLSSGMPPSLWLDTADPEENWKRFKPFLANVQNLTYYRSLLGCTYRDLYGFDDYEITDENWRALSESISEAYARDDFYESVFERLNIELALLDPFWDAGYISEKPFLKPSPGMDPFIFARSRKHQVANPGNFNIPVWQGDTIENVLAKWGAGYTSFKEFLGLIDRAFETIQKMGGRSIKYRIGYNRTLKIDRVSRAEAEKCFHIDDEKITLDEVKKIEDYIIRYCTERAIDSDFAVQIHTGMQGTLGGNTSNCDPLLLTNFFLDYPNQRFSVFHSAFPWISQAAVLVAGYPNVCLDICWLSWTLGYPLVKYLHEILAIVPCNKIMIGGDAECVDSMYRAFMLNKRYVAEVLAERIENGDYQKQTAIDIAKKMFRENTKSFYRM